MASQQQDEPIAPSQEPGEGPGNTAPEGGENSAPEGGEERAAERSAERAAAFAATEGFHPLRLRPYVPQPGGEGGESTVRKVHDGPDGDGPTPADLGLFPEAYAGYEYPEPDEQVDPAEFDGEDAAALAARRGRHRRRRRGLVVAAAAVAASALAAGAVAVTGQVMSDEQGAAGQALPDLTSSSVPDVTLPTDAAPATAKGAAPVAQESARARTPVQATPSTSAPVSATPTATAPTPSGTPGATPSGAPSSPASSGTPTQPAPPVAPASAQVLQLGDSGPAVEDLQRRLAEVWVYHGAIDGVFDKQVQHAVATFQVWYWVSDAPDGSHDGVYGPNTRAALERQTSGL